MKIDGAGNPIVLCVATQPRGHAFISELLDRGCSVTVFTLEELREAGWPPGAEVETMPGGMSPQQIQNAVTYLTRSRNFVRVFALAGADAAIAAALREHMRVAGMGATSTRYFTDIVAMRAKAAHAGLRVPAFTLVLNYDVLRGFLQEVPAPWRLRPRMIGGTGSVRIFEDAEAVWRELDELGDAQSDYFLEQAIDGDILMADGLVAEGQMRLNSVEDPIEPAALSTIKGLHGKLISALGMARGVTHSRFLLSTGSGSLYFLETAPVPGESAGEDLWREWARLEIAALRGKNTIPFGHNSAIK